MCLLFWLIPLTAVIALVCAYYLFSEMKKANPGTERMQEIAGYVRKGAIAYLTQQYKVVGLVFVIVSGMLVILSFGVDLQNKWCPFAMLTAGFSSGLAGFFGIKTATAASSRTAYAASQSLNAGL